MQWIGSQWRDFYEVLYLNVFRNSVEKIEVSLKSDNKDRYLHEEQYTFLIAPRSVLLRMRNITDKICREDQNTHFIFNNFFPRKSWRVWENVEKCWRAILATDKNIIRRMRIACCIHKATNTRNSYCLSTATLLAQKRLNRRSILILSSHLRLGLLPLGFITKTCIHPLPPHRCYMSRPSHSSRFDHPNNIWWGVQIIKLLIV
jgi:hypothetical protein